MGEKFNFGDIRNDIFKNKKIANEFKDDEESWSQYDSSLSAFGSSFNKTLPEEYITPLNKKIFTNIDEYGEVFKNYVEDTLSKNKNHYRTAIEFGGPGSNLFSGFSPNFFSKTIGLCLDDVRGRSQKEYDHKKGHSIITGDIMKPNNNEMYLKIEDELGTNKVDLIISRMMGPLRSTNDTSLKKNPLILDRIIRKWYNLLNENSLLFAQFEYFSEHNPDPKQIYDAESFPPSIKPLEEKVSKWAEIINKKFKNKIEIQLGRGVMRLYKKSGAPEELPKINELF